MTTNEQDSRGEPWWLPLRRALGHVRRCVELDTYDVFARGVEPAHRDFQAPAGYRFAWGTAQDVAGCDEHHTELDARERALGSARLDLGHRVVIGFQRGPQERDTAVFSMWVNPRHLNVPGHVKRALQPDQVFIYKAYTSPEHRGRKLYEAGMRFVLADLAARGGRELIGYAHVKKDVSRRGLAALGFAPRGRFWRLKTPLGSTCRVSRELAALFPRAVARSRALDGNPGVLAAGEPA
ncbi:MAG: hypothetical protein FJ299_08380 [Planctomycetes bacterium]|nr:hypothetical protein [Planctomycetota bacterium]